MIIDAGIYKIFPNETIGLIVGMLCMIAELVIFIYLKKLDKEADESYEREQAEKRKAAEEKAAQSRNKTLQQSVAPNVGTQTEASELLRQIPELRGVSAVYMQDHSISEHEKMVTEAHSHNTSAPEAGTQIHKESEPKTYIHHRS